MRSRYVDQSLLLVFVLFVSIIPFSNRAIYMDEHLYLGLAESALQNPLYPQDTPWLYFGTWFSNAADHTHPPLGEYHLALLYKLFGHFSERSFRILFGAPYAILAVLGFYGLAARWTKHPFWVSLVFAACPPFFVMSPALMMDLPSVGCLLMGLRIFLSPEIGGPVRIAASAVFFIGAMGMAYTAAIPLCALLLLCLQERRPVREMLAIVVPFFVLVLWLLAMTMHFGEFPLKGTVSYALSQFKPFHNLAAALSFIGGLAMFPWSFAAFKGFSRAMAGVCFICAAIPLFWLTWPSALAAALYFAMASWGAALILRLRFGVSAVFLSSWFFLSLVFFILAADMMTARYLLLYLPPLYLLLFRETAASTLKRVAVPTIALSLCIAIADYRFVDGYRAWVNNNIPIFAASGYRVWSATESGLRFYLKQQGAESLDSRSLRPRGTDLVIQHSNLFRYALAGELGSMLVELKEFEIQDAFPLRTFNAAVGAGFHDSRIGLVPFTFSTAALDSIRVTQVSPFVRQLPVPARNEYNNVPVWTPDGVEFKQHGREITFDMPDLRNVRWTGDLLGFGMVELGHRSMTLRLDDGDTAVWRNFRIVPKGF
jgi:hypothetical protein